MGTISFLEPINFLRTIFILINKKNDRISVLLILTLSNFLLYKKFWTHQLEFLLMPLARYLLTLEMCMGSSDIRIIFQLPWIQIALSSSKLGYMMFGKGISTIYRGSVRNFKSQAPGFFSLLQALILTCLFSFYKCMIEKKLTKSIGVRSLSFQNYWVLKHSFHSY